MRPQRSIPHFAVLAAATFITAPAMAEGFHDLAAIDTAVARFTGAQIGQAGGAQGPVDRQMRLAACGQSPAVDWYGSAQSAVRVSCPGSWRIFVPVTAPVAAARHAAPELEAPAIARRDLLRVEAGGSGFRVTRQGEAMEEGRVGQSIRVKLEDGSRQGRIVTAQVIEPGRVRVPMR